MNKAIQFQEVSLELKRLDRIHDQIRKLQSRIDKNTSTLGVARLAKLIERLDEMKEEEELIIERIKEKSVCLEDQNGLSRRFVELADTHILVKKTSESKKSLDTNLKDPFQFTPAVNPLAESGKRIIKEIEPTVSTETETEEEVEERKECCDDGDEEYFRTRAAQWLVDCGMDQDAISVFDLPLDEQFLSFPDLIDAGVN